MSIIMLWGISVDGIEEVDVAIVVFEGQLLDLC